MTLAAEAPDLDVLSSFKGPVYGFAHHRGFTHSFLGLMAVSGVVVGLIYLLWILRGRKASIPNLPPRWGLLFVFAYIAGLSHIFLDFTNNYGVRPFWPFFEKWYSWDIVFIVEPALYIFLVAGLVLPVFLSRHNPLPRGRMAATIALLCVIGFYAVRDHEHRNARHAIERQPSDADAPLRVSVYPYYWSLFRWYGVVETKDSFITSDLDSRTGELDPAERERIPKPLETPATIAAKRSYLGRVYLDWAQYPMVTEVSHGSGYHVEFRDLRFGYPRLSGRRNILSASVDLDEHLRVVRESVGTRAQQPPLD